MELTILMPCLNEEKTIAFCINEAKGYIAKSNINAEILIADNGSVMLIDDNSPIVLSVKNPDSLENLSTGDKILVFHDGIRESYPAQTFAQFVMKLGSGTEADIPADVITQLRELGWIKQ